jgi:hypothetical protein
MKNAKRQLKAMAIAAAAMLVANVVVTIGGLDAPTMTIAIGGYLIYRDMVKS